MKVIQTELPEVLIIEPVVHKDARGFFMENYSAQRYQEAGVEGVFLQDNISASQKGVIRGLHYQLQHPQGKLVTVLQGKVFDVVVDIRPHSPRFKQWVGIELSDDNNRQVYVPPGFAHGFCTLTDHVLFHYKCTDYYNPQDEYGVRFDDRDIGIEWPLQEGVMVSDKDKKLPLLKEVPPDQLPLYGMKA